MPASPRVTLGMPVHNGAAYLSQAIESVLAQTWDDFELLIADNASSDETEEICREYARRDPRIVYRRHGENLGAAANYNAVLAWARGEYFRWAAHDDLLQPTLIEALAGALAGAGPGVVLAFSDTTVIDAEGAFVEDYVHRAPWRGGGPSRRVEDLLAHPDSYLHLCYPVFGLIRTTALRRTRGVGSYESADMVLLLELALRGDFVHVEERLFLRRDHSGSSRRANVSPEDRLRWFDTTSAGYAMPRTILARRYLSAITSAPLGAADTARCLRSYLRWLTAERRLRVIGGELRAAVAARLRSAT